jgi:peptidoglycan/xylan/chitin deacetylase (PgdA/CDA1 family)
MTITVTTSWDDGHVLDMRLAGLLNRYSLPATFYLAPKSEEVDPTSRLSPSQIIELAAQFEIGGHTLTHRPLPSLLPSEAESEIIDGKIYLEDLIQVPVTSFCYPRGEYGVQHVEMVRQAGFSYARTTRRYVTEPSSDPLQTGTTVHAYRHAADLHGLGRHVWETRKILRIGFLFLDWDQLAIRLFDDLVCSDTPSSRSIYHLWGHSWEIQGRGEWQHLHRVLDHIAHRAEVRYAPNGSTCS